jgi:transcriptional regulator with XRE-family HTH domain
LDKVRKLISDRLTELDLTMKEVSARMGRNESYVRQFLKRGHPTELGERDREKIAQVLGISPDELRGPANPLPARINGADARPLVTLPSSSLSVETSIEELREKCRISTDPYDHGIVGPID